jgi:hypothetical protein
MQLSSMSGPVQRNGCGRGEAGAGWLSCAICDRVDAVPDAEDSIPVGDAEVRSAVCIAVNQDSSLKRHRERPVNLTIFPAAHVLRPTIGHFECSVAAAFLKGAAARFFLGGHLSHFWRHIRQK